jgi:hypothetical protein
MDGNFCAEHMKMQNPDDDVALSDGDSYFTATKEYQTHLLETIEAKQAHF